MESDSKPFRKGNIRIPRYIVATLFLLSLSIIFYLPVLRSGETFFAFGNLYRYLPWSAVSAEDPATNPLITDPLNQIYTFYHFARDCLDKGQLPFWNPNYFSGAPTAPGAISLLGNPIVLLSHWLLPICEAHDLLLWISLMGSGWFMYRYLRQIELSLLSALTGAVSWMFNGYVMVWFEFEIVSILAFSLPASLYFVEAWFQKGRFSSLLGLVFFIGIAIGSGYAHLLIYQALFLIAYLIFCLFRYRKSILDRIDAKAVGQMALAMLLVLLLSGIFLSSHAAALKQSQRKSYSLDELFDHTASLPGKYLPTLIFPDLYGNPADQFAFTPREKPSQLYNNYNELCLYAGIATLLLACFSFFSFFQRPFVPFFAISSLLFLTLPMGSALYYPLASFIPGLAVSTPTRLLFLFGFTFSVLAGIGAEILLRCSGTQRYVALATCSVFLVLALVMNAYLQSDDGMAWASGVQDLSSYPELYHDIQKHFSLFSKTLGKPLLLLIASCVSMILIAFSRSISLRNRYLWILILILSYDLLSFGSHYNSTSPKSKAFPESEGIRFLKKDPSRHRVVSFGGFFQNSLSVFGIEDAGGYQSFFPRRYGEYVHLSQYGADTPIPENLHRSIKFRGFGSPLLHLLNIRYLLFPASASLDFPQYPLVYDGEIRIYRNRNAFPRAFFVTEYRWCDSRQDAFQLLSTFQTEDFRKRVVLENGQRPDVVAANPSGEENEASLIWIAYQNDSIEIDVRTQSGGYLVISDGYHPDWEVSIDGIPTRLYRANAVMRSVFVPAGRHRVRMEFSPRALMAGAGMTLLGWAALLISAVCCGAVEWTRRQNEKPSV